MKKKDIENFVNTHRDFKFSAAMLEYSLFVCDGIEGRFHDFLSHRDASIEEFEFIDSFGKYDSSSDNKEIEALIAEAVDAEALVRLMRKGMIRDINYKFRQKLLENEDLVMPLIKEKAISNRQDIFIENALYFFLRCRTNVCDWFVENYHSFKSEYLKSMFCLILGFRGTKELIPFLMDEADRFEKYYPDEDYDQAPIIAVQELAYRFLN